MSKKLRTLVIGAIVAVGSLSVAAPAQAVVCHDDPGQCCQGIVILGKEYLHYDC